MIYNSQSDNKVLSDICENYIRHKEEGFTKIMGLRDVFCKAYIDDYKHLYNEEGVKLVINNLRESVPIYFKHECKDIYICFSIMEIEAWIIGIFKTSKNFRSEFGIIVKEGDSLSKISDPEKIVHPSKKLIDFLKDKEYTYNKHWKNFKTYLLKIKKEDFKLLYESTICKSFNEFVDNILN